MTTDNATQAMFAAYDQQVDKLHLEGKISKEWLMLTQKIARHIGRRQWQAAISGYDQAIKSATDMGDVAAQALGHYGQGVAMLQVSDRMADARQAFQTAAELGESVEHGTIAAKSHFLLSTFYLDEGDFETALAEQSRAVEQVDEINEPELAVLIRRNRATTSWSLGQFSTAQSDLTAALAIAQGMNDPNSAAAVQSDLLVLQSFTDPEQRSPQAFAALLEQARKSGSPELVGDVILHQAVTFLERGQLQQALKQAEQGRQAALKSTDPQRYLRYLSACLIIAAILEQRKDRAGVLEILLTCKGTLERTLGQGSGALVSVFLDQLPEKWGSAELQQALKGYRRQIQEKLKKQQVAEMSA